MTKTKQSKTIPAPYVMGCIVDRWRLPLRQTKSVWKVLCKYARSFVISGVLVESSTLIYPCYFGWLHWHWDDYLIAPCAESWGSTVYNIAISAINWWQTKISQKYVSLPYVKLYDISMIINKPSKFPTNEFGNQPCVFWITHNGTDQCVAHLITSNTVCSLAVLRRLQLSNRFFSDTSTVFSAMQLLYIELFIL